MFLSSELLKEHQNGRIAMELPGIVFTSQLVCPTYVFRLCDYFIYLSIIHLFIFFFFGGGGGGWVWVWGDQLIPYVC